MTHERAAPPPGRTLTSQVNTSKAERETAIFHSREPRMELTAQSLARLDNSLHALPRHPDVRQHAPHVTRRASGGRRATADATLGEHEVVAEAARLLQRLREIS